MIESLNQVNISPGGWLLAIFGSFLLGVAKGGVKGLGAIISIITALVFGSKASTGIVMPLLMIGDTFAVMYYHRHARWSYLWKLMPWIVAGVLIGVWYGKDLQEDQFKKGMAIIIFASAGFMLITERKNAIKIPDNTFFAAIMGSLAGFTQDGMRQTVTVGTARSLNTLPVEISGKTGTAQFDARDLRRTHAWFTSYAPSTDPQIALTILIESGGEGSSVCVPVAKQVYAWWVENRYNKQ